MEFFEDFDCYKCSCEGQPRLFPHECFNCFKKAHRIDHQSPRRALINKFMDASVGTSFTAWKNVNSNEDHTEVFLSYAKLYIVGDKYLVHELKDHALHRLHETLKVFTLYPSRIRDIFVLVKHVFYNTAEEDRLRSMIALCTACVV